VTPIIGPDDHHAARATEIEHERTSTRGGQHGHLASADCAPLSSDDGD